MQCKVCEVACNISEKSSGRCGTYMTDGKTIFQDPDIGYMGAYPISIETVPMVHFYPSGKFLQVFSTGCNFQCPGCVTRLLASNRTLGWPTMTPSQIIAKALQEECIGVVSTLNEPAANFFNFRKLAMQARSNDLLAGCSTNCYFTKETTEELGNMIDFVNVGIKGYSDVNYRSCGVNSSAPVFRNIESLFDMGVHVEVSALYSKGSEAEVIEVAKALAAISPEIPMQIMRFIPFGDAPIILEPSTGEAEKLCMSLREHMDYVYLFNSPGTNMLHTYCVHCGNLLAEREFYGPMGSHLIEPWTKQTCSCGYTVPITGKVAMESFGDSGFTGGYRISRAFGMVHAVLAALGENDDQKLLDVWRQVSKDDGLTQLHLMIQQPASYFQLIGLVAEKLGAEERGEELSAYMREKLDMVSTRTANCPPHPVYYCMGSPIFALNAGRMENNLVSLAGGTSINRLLQKEGKPGVSVGPDFINSNNPKTIFISGFLPRPLDEFYGLCEQYGIEPDAVKEKRVYVIPPSWDFGSPRWIMGLLFIADKLHPGKMGYDIETEADEFYKRFYGIAWKDVKPNRSFHRPTSGKWPSEV